MPINLFTNRNRQRTTIWFLCLFIMLVATVGSHAQQNTPTIPAKHCLWVLETPLNKISLLGSLHVLKSENYPLASAIEDAYASSQKVVFETDLGAMVTPENQAIMLSLGLYPQGQTLFQNVSEDTRRSLETTMKNLGLPMEQFVRFRPWFLAVTLTTFELQRLGFNPMFGIDVYFYGKAKADKKEIGFLESVEYQLNLLGKMNNRHQNAFLNQTLKDLKLAAKMADDMVHYWEEGDAGNLHALLFKSFEDYPEIKDRLLIQRNQDWALKIENMLGKEKDVLVVVGAGHLVGPQSVIELLKKKGYNVKQQ